MKNGINDEEDIAVELSGVDEETVDCLGKVNFGGLRKALVGSITGFIHLVNRIILYPARKT